ncbi:MAG: DUF3012 domain-containing protein [Rhodospirillales bacterium]
MKNTFAALAVVSLMAFATTACSPEVVSKEWCEDMKKKDKGKWTAEDTKNFGKHCLLK